MSVEYRRIAQENGAEILPWPISGSGVAYTVQGTTLQSAYRINEDETVSLSKILSDLKIPKNGTNEYYAISDVNGITCDPANGNLTVVQVDGDWTIQSTATFTDSVSLTLAVGENVNIDIAVTCPERIPITITADDGNKTYDGTALSVNTWKVTSGSLAEGDTIESVSVEGSQTNAGTSDNVPSAVIIKNGSDVVTNQYDITYVNGTLTVNSAEVTLTANSGTETYDGTEKTVAGFVPSVEGLTFADTVSAGVSGTNAGEYDVTFGGVTLNETKDTTGNYVVSETTNGKLTIKPREVTVSGIKAEDKTYDGTTKATLDFSNVTINDAVDGDDLTVSAEGMFEDANVGTDKNVTLSGMTLGGESAANYTLAAEGQQTKATASISALDVTVKIVGASNTAVYDSQEHTVSGYTATAYYKPNGETEEVCDFFDVDANVVFSGTAEARRTNVVDGVDADGVTYMGLTADQFTAAAVEGSNFGNVAFEVTDGYQAITPMPVTLIANSGYAQYDAKNPQEEQTVSGFTCTTTASDGHAILLYDSEDENVPEYPEYPIPTFVGVSAFGSGKDVGMYEVTFAGVTVKTQDAPGTRDTTGNYEVTEAVSGMLIITDSQYNPIQKSMADEHGNKTFNGNLATYRIVVNQGEDILNNCKELILKDTFSRNQSIIYSTIRVEADDPAAAAKVTYDYSGYTGTFKIPDEKKIIITYTTRVSGEAGQTVKFDNTARLGKDGDSGFVGCASTVNEEEIVTPTGTDITGTGGEYTIQLYVYPDGEMEKGLDGAVFRLLDSNQRPIQVNGSDVTFITGANGADHGYQTIALTGDQAIRKNTAYYLEMITAPYTVERDDETDEDVYTYYQKDNTLYSFVITDSPSYSLAGVYTYYNNDTLKVRCYPETTGVNVTKRFSGNYSLTGEQRNKIEFVVQKEDTAASSEKWDDVDGARYTYAQAPYGSLNFTKNKWIDGVTWKALRLENGSNYRVEEEKAGVADLGLPDGVEHRTSYTISYQSNKDIVEEEGNSFIVNPKDVAYSYSVVVNNEYIEHKLTLGLLDEDKGKILPGGTFTVYAANDPTTPIATYTTGEDGMVAIRKGDVYADDTLYFAVQTDAPTGYLLPDEPERVRFYFAQTDISTLPDAINLTNAYDTVILGNRANVVRVPVTVTWGLEESGIWPEGVDHIVLGLTQSVDGGKTYSRVQKNGTDWTIELNKDTFFDNGTFVKLPAQLEETDPEDPEKTILKDITYSIEERAVYSAAEESDATNITTQYATTCDVSGTGWYVVKHQSAVSVKVEKQWYALKENESDPDVQITGDHLNEMGSVTVDLYQLKTVLKDGSADLTRDDIEDALDGANPIRGGLVLSKDNSWTVTEDSLPATYLDNSGTEKAYHYYALETDVPDNHEDTYVITEAEGTQPRTLTVKNTATPITVNVNAVNRNKTYGDADPEYEFKVKVQDPGTTIGAVEGTGHSSVSGPDADGYYTVSGTNDAGGYDIAVTTGSEPSKLITFTCSRKIGENVGDYVVTPAGGARQEGYRVTYKEARLTIGQKPITVKADKSKVYGADDPAVLVSFYHKDAETEELIEYTDALENNDPFTVITYTAERVEGEDVNEYEVFVNGAADQGNYRVTVVEQGVFTIEPKEVTVVPNDAGKVYGDEDPDLTATVSGFLVPDTADDFDYVLSRVYGENVGEYTITATPSSAIQGNYTLNCEAKGTFTITPASVTLKAEDASKIYGEDDPEPWSVEIEGLVGSDTVRYEMTRAVGQDAGEYAITPIVKDSEPQTDSEGKTYYPQDNYHVYVENGTLTVDKADLTITADDKSKVEGAEDPELTATLEGLVDRDGVLTSSSAWDESEKKWTVTYKREGAEEPEISFTLAREAGEDARQEYVVSVSGVSAKNYTVETVEGVFTILEKHDVDISQVTVDPTDASANPGYTYHWTATLDSADYSDAGDISLPDATEGAETPNTATIQVAHGATLTVTQQASEEYDANYETTLSVDGKPYDNQTGIPNTIRLVVDDYYALTFTHSQNCLPVYAKTEPEVGEEGTPETVPGSSGFVAIPDGVLTVEAYEADYRETIELPAHMYYVFDYAALFTAGGEAIEGASNVTGVRYVAEDKKWQNTLEEDPTAEGAVFTNVNAGAQLVVFYKPKYICKIGDNKFYTLNQAMTYVAEQTSRTAVIEMLIENYEMPKADKVIIPADEGYDITIQTAQTEYEGASGTKAVITRDSLFASGDMFECFGKLTLDNIVIDGGGVNSANVVVSVKQKSEATEAPSFTLNDSATLRNAVGNNGAAVYINGGSAVINGELKDNSATNGSAAYVTGGTVTFNESSSVVGNTATGNGGAVYVNNGTVNLNSANVTGNSAVQGGALYMARLNNSSVTAVTLSGTIGATAEGSANTATEGGAIYVAAGDLTVNGSVLGNTATANGGGLFVNGGTVTMNSASTVGGGNSAEYGGGLYVAGGTLNLSTGSITGNTASGNGGGVFTTGSLTIGCVVTGNSAVNGGGIYASGGTLATTGDITGNTASSNGGGIYQASGTLNLNGGSVSNNTATGGNGGAIYAINVTTTIPGEVSTTLSGNRAAGGNGGALYMDGGSLKVGTVDVHCTFGGTATGTANTARNGGAIYATSGEITIGKGYFTNNQASASGGAIYTQSASVTATGGSITGNAAEQGNGGAICSASGTLIVSGGTFSGNEAKNRAENATDGLGGALYADTGNVTYSGGSMTANKAVNGAALFVGSGIAAIKAGITGNIASDGGTIGVGSASARLQFSDQAHVYDNIFDNKQRNVCLNVDSESVIYANSLNSGNAIGVYVPGDVDSDQVVKHGDVTGYFGAYVTAGTLANLTTVFKNDRFAELGVQYENNRLYWYKNLSYDVYYLKNYDSQFPPTASYTTTPSKKICSGKSYALRTRESDIYDLVMAMKLYEAHATDFTNNVGSDYASTAVYAYTFSDKAWNNTFGNYLKTVRWDATARKWIFFKQDGTRVPDDTTKIIIFYSAPAYLTIVNNNTSGLELDISELTVLNRNAGDGVYGFVTAKNGATVQTLRTLTADDLKLNAGDSIKLLFPGAQGQSFTLKGTFTGEGAGDSTTVEYTFNGGTKQIITGTTVDLSSYSLNSSDEAAELVFGDPLPICKIGNQTFQTLKAAMEYAKDQKNTTSNNAYTIEMLVDYLVPKDDVLDIPAGYDITFTTSQDADFTGSRKKDPTKEGSYNQAILSRDTGNAGSSVKSSGDTLTIEKLAFDGRSLTAGGAGGAISTDKNVATVIIKNCEFTGYRADQGGAIYVGDFNGGYNKANSSLTVEDCDFSNCQTNASSGDKVGGGGIWTTARALFVRRCTFDGCACLKGIAQAGAVFHNIQGGWSANSKTEISDCTFQNCFAVGGSGGTVESDALDVTVQRCSFEGSYTNKKGGSGGAINTYANNAASTGTYCIMRVIDCTINNCSAKNGSAMGGAVRCSTHDLILRGCIFRNTQGVTGGAVAMTNSNAEKVEIYGCTFDNCTATGNGGAVSAPVGTLIVGVEDAQSEDYRATYLDGTEKDGKNHFTDCAANRGGGIDNEKDGSSVSMENVHFIRCVARNSTGGALHTKAQTLSITGDSNSFTNCTGYGNGGAVHQNRNAANSSVTLENCVFTGCEAFNNGNGGGMYANARTLTVNYDTTTNSVVQNAESRFVNCTAANAGGGLYHNYTGTANIANCGFDGCTAKAANGGGLYTTAHTLSVSGAKSVFKTCTAQTGGGGVYHNRDANGSSASYEDCAFDGCVTNGNNGGAIYEPAKTVTVTDCTIANSSAPANGGGIWINPTTATFTGGTISGNTVTNSDSKGAGIYISGGTVTCKDTETYNCTATGNGGGIYQNNGTLNILGGVVHGTASNGGGIYQYDSNAKVYQYGGAVGGTATANGGGVYKNNGTYTLGDGTVDGVTYSGGNIGRQISVQVQFVENNATKTRRDTFTSSAVNGGGVYQNQGTFNLNAGGSIGQKLTELTDNDTGDATYTATATGNGGGVYNSNGTFNMTDASICGSASDNGGVYNNLTFVQNAGDIDGSATYGGGLYQNKTYTFTAGTITGTATQNGGAVYAANGLTINSGCTVGQKMTTDGDGNETVVASSFATDGGVYVAGGTVTLKQGGAITGATASGNGGGAYVGGGTLNLGAYSNNTLTKGGDITDNSANNGAGVYVGSGAFSMYDGSISRNEATANGGGVYHAGGTFTMSGGTIGGAPTGSGEEAVENGNTAAKGAGLFVAVGQTASLNGWIKENDAFIGAYITHNRASVEGGGIAVGGTGTRLSFTNKVVVSDNTFGADNTLCNVYLDQDSNAIIQKASLDSASYIGVYTSNAQDSEHGLSGKHFGTYTNTNAVNRFINDRRPYLYGVQGVADDDNTAPIDWATFKCKITDAEGNLLYMDANGTPAVFTKLENNGDAGTDSAFGVLYGGTALYRRVEAEDDQGNKTVSYEPYTSGSSTYPTDGTTPPYQVQMLVPRYEQTQKIGLKTGMNVMLTTASTTEDECGFKYSGNVKETEAIVIRHAVFGSMIEIKGGELTLSKITIDGGYNEEAQYTSNTNGGILLMTSSGIVNINAKAKLCNSYTTSTGGGAVRMDKNTNTIVNLNGGEIDNCGIINTADNWGGGVGVGEGFTLNINGGSITNCSAKNGGGVRVDGTINMNSGTITGNNATADGGGISIGRDTARINFQGECVVKNNTLNNTTPCNLELNRGKTGIINLVAPLSGNSEIGVYTKVGNMRSNYGVANKPFGTWSSDEGLYCFINDCDKQLRGGKKSDTDTLIYWLASPILKVTKHVVSDWAEDSNKPFSFTVQLEGAGFTKSSNRYGDLVFDQSGKAEFTLTAGETKTAAGFPTGYIGTVGYTVTEEMSEEEQVNYPTTDIEKDETAYIPESETPYAVTGTLGENIDNTEASTSTSAVEFTNTRRTASLTVSNEVVSSSSADLEQVYNFTLSLPELADDAVEASKGYSYTKIDADGNTTGSGELTFSEEKTYAFTLGNGESFTFEGLPKEMPYTVTETLTDAQAGIRTRVSVNGGDPELLEDAREKSGEIGSIEPAEGGEDYTSTIHFINSKMNIVCKITNSVGTLLKRKTGDEDAVYERLEDAFSDIANNQLKNASGLLRIEMVVPKYTMTETATLISGKTVILTTASPEDTDGYPYNGGVDDENGNRAVIYRGFNGGSMIVDNGVLTVGNIVLDGGSVARDEGEETFAGSGNGGIIQVNNSVTLTVDAEAVLCNSGVTETTVEGGTVPGLGGAIWMSGGSRLVMSGSIENCSASSGGGVYAVDGFRNFNVAGAIKGCVATDGDGGAIYAGTSTASTGITINPDTQITGNRASGNGGGIYSSASINVKGGEIGDNTATGNGGGVCMDMGATFTMSSGSVSGNGAMNGGGVYAQSTVKIGGGSITGNTSPQGAVATGDDSVLTFSKNAVVSGNTMPDGTTAMNLYLGYANNTIIQTAGLGSYASIGVYVGEPDDAEDKSVYYGHGIAGRPFGTYTGANAPGKGARLDKFINDRLDRGVSLTGTPGRAKTEEEGAGYFIMWQGKSLLLTVAYEDENGNEQPVSGAKFTLTNLHTINGEDDLPYSEDDVQVWTGVSASDGTVTVPWGIVETADGGVATFLAGSVYRLEQTASAGNAVRPAGTWTVTVGSDNSLTWTDTQSDQTNVNRTLEIKIQTESFLGVSVDVSNDLRPTITYDSNGKKIITDGVVTSDAKLADGSVIRSDPVEFRAEETRHEYTIGELNPSRPGYVFVNWTVEENVSTEIGIGPIQPEDESDAGDDGKVNYTYGEKYTFHRGSDDDRNVTFKANWEPVKCKITDVSDRLLYVNGSPAVYMTMWEAFRDFNEKSFTLENGYNRGTPRKIKMLVPEYTMTQPVALEAILPCVLTTASKNDTDGYPYTGDEDTVCTVTRGFEGGAMIRDEFNLTLTNITLDGAKETYSGRIIDVEYGPLTVSTGATLQNSKVTGNGGAIHGDEYSTIHLNGGAVSGCEAVVNSEATGDSEATGNGGVVYSLGMVKVGGTSLMGNTASVNGGGIDAAGLLTMTGGAIRNCEAVNAGGGIYATGSVEISGSTEIDHCSATGGQTDGQTDDDPPTRYGDGGAIFQHSGTLSISGSASIVDCTAYNNGGAIYNESASVTISGGVIDGHVELAADTANAINGGGVYMAAGALTMSGSATVVSNTATNGGGVYMAAGTLSMSGSSGIDDNRASVNGGGVFLDDTSTLTLSGEQAEISGNAADTYGGAVYQNSSGASGNLGFTMESGSVTGNTAVLGGAVYIVDGKAFEMKGGAISSNSATGIESVDGGAINVGGEDARLVFSGSPVIYDNPNAAAGTRQKNVVLSVGDTDVIRSKGITGSYGTAKIGVYVIDGDEDRTIYMKHGIYDKPFGNFTDDGNLDVFRNDRNGALYGVKKDDDLIYWQNVVCKLTDSDGALLYEDPYGLTPAVYATLAMGFGAAKKTLYHMNGNVVYTGALRLKMLEDYAIDSDEKLLTYEADRDLTFTTAEKEISELMENNGDVYIYAPVVGGSEKATITRKQSASSMITVDTSKSFAVTDLILDGGSIETNVDGGIFKVAVGELILQSGAVLTNSIAKNGGAAYVADGASMTMTSGTINGNTATTDGAGIYLEEYSTLKLSGSPDFGGTGRKTDDVDSEIITEDVDGNPIGNFTTGVTLSDDALNGQKEYAKARQDIFLAGFADEEGHEGETPATSIVVTGVLDVDSGSIWVWAGNPAHYEMLKQFAVFESETVKNALSNGKKLESTMQAFRNAWDDESTGCGADYLTGQEGDDLSDGTNTWKCIYWTGGFDFVFKKINGNGNKLDDAVFTLYKAVESPANSGKYYPVKADGSADTTFKAESDWDAYKQTDKDNGGKKPATATSGSGTQSDALAGTEADYAVAIKVDNGTDKPDEKGVYGEGLAVFEKIPPGVYFIKETEFPMVEGTTVYYEAVEQMYMVDLNGKGYFTIYTAGEDDDGNTEWTKDAANKAPTAKFVKETSTGKYTAPTSAIPEGAETVDIYIFLNIDSRSRKVILKKVDGEDDKPLENATFTVYYADKQTVVRVENGKDVSGNPTYELLKDKSSGAAGVFWIGKLPYGIYYLHETVVPTGYKDVTEDGAGNGFILTVSEDGVGRLQKGDPDKIVNELEPETTKP